MRFWDSSAVVPLLVVEAGTPKARTMHGRDPAMLVWWLTEVECVSAIARLERAGAIGPDRRAGALDGLDDLAADWDEIEPAAAVRRSARRLLQTHDLRGIDALQLAAAIQGSEGLPETMEFVSQDLRLNAAARREGFVVLDPRDA